MGVDLFQVKGNPKKVLFPDGSIKEVYPLVYAFRPYWDIWNAAQLGHSWYNESDKDLYNYYRRFLGRTQKAAARNYVVPYGFKTGAQVLCYPYGVVTDYDDFCGEKVGYLVPHGKKGWRVSTGKYVWEERVDTHPPKPPSPGFTPVLRWIYILEGDQKITIDYQRWEVLGEVGSFEKVIS